MSTIGTAGTGCVTFRMRPLAIAETRLRRVFADVIPKVHPLRIAADDVVEVLIHPELPALAEHSVDFPSAVALPRLDDLRK